MLKIKTRDSLALAYSVLNEEGMKKSKMIAINSLNTELADDDLYDIAVKIRDLMAYSVLKILRRSEVMFVDN